MSDAGRRDALEPVRTCVLGVGRLGAEHARLLAELSHLVGVSDRDPVRAAQVAQAVGTRSFDDPRQLLAASEAAVVAVPTRHHFDLANLALEAGCHVLVEKPIAGSLEEADALVSRAEECELALCVGHVERFNGILLACRPWIDRPRYIESLRLAPFQPRGTDVTVILDLMIHDIDLVLGLADSPLVEVGAVGVPVISGSVDIANARLAFESGAVANITASRVSLRPTRQLRLFQPSGYFSLDLAAGRGEFLRRRASAPPGAASLAELVERVPLETDGEEPLKRELEAFLAAVRGDPSGAVSGREGREALAVALGITREIEEFADVVAQDS